MKLTVSCDIFCKRTVYQGPGETESQVKLYRETVFELDHTGWCMSRIVRKRGEYVQRIEMEWTLSNYDMGIDLVFREGRDREDNWRCDW